MHLEDGRCVSPLLSWLITHAGDLVQAPAMPVSTDMVGLEGHS